jgi:hypothetical protein
MVGRQTAGQWLGGFVIDELVLVDPLQLVAPQPAHADPVLDHEIRQPTAVDKDDPWLYPRDVVRRVVGEP